MADQTEKSHFMHSHKTCSLEVHISKDIETE